MLAYRAVLFWGLSGGQPTVPLGTDDVPEPSFAASVSESLSPRVSSIFGEVLGVVGMRQAQRGVCVGEEALLWDCYGQHPGVGIG